MQTTQDDAELCSALNDYMFEGIENIRVVVTTQKNIERSQERKIFIYSFLKINLIK